jgi:hypothetical protein
VEHEVLQILHSRADVEALIARVEEYHRRTPALNHEDVQRMIEEDRMRDLEDLEG